VCDGISILKQAFSQSATLLLFGPRVPGIRICLICPDSVGHTKSRTPIGPACQYLNRSRKNSSAYVSRTEMATVASGAGPTTELSDGGNVAKHKAWIKKSSQLRVSMTIKRITVEESDRNALESYQRLHEKGIPRGMTWAVGYCLKHSLPMPEWLGSAILSLVELHEQEWNERHTFRDSGMTWNEARLEAARVFHCSIDTVIKSYKRVKRNHEFYLFLKSARSRCGYEQATGRHVVPNDIGSKEGVVEGRQGADSPTAFHLRRWHDA
jgi:hypothetical protein